MSRRHLKVASIFAVVLAAFYLGGAFVAVSFNIATWTPEGRFVALAVGCFCAFCVWAADEGIYP